MSIRFGNIARDFVVGSGNWIEKGTPGNNLSYDDLILPANNKYGCKIESNVGKGIYINYSVLSEDIQAQQILFEMAQFQKKILEICEKRNLSSLCDYLYSMCRLFSQWYGNPDHSIKLCKDFNLKVVRLNFCQAVAKCVETGMKILGITPLERM